MLLLHVCTSCRALTTDDFEAGNVTLAVTPASAQPYSASPVTSSLADTAVIPLGDRTAALDLSFSAAPLALAAAGDTVTFVLEAVNTGTLRLRNVDLSIPADINSTLACTTDGIASAPRAAVLEPGSVVRCNASLTVTTARIEAGPQQLSVSAAAGSVLGAMVPVAKSVLLQPSVNPVLSVTIDVAGCTKPTKAGGLGL